MKYYDMNNLSTPPITPTLPYTFFETNLLENILCFLLVTNTKIVINMKTLYIVYGD